MRDAERKALVYGCLTDIGGGVLILMVCALIYMGVEVLSVIM